MDSWIAITTSLLVGAAALGAGGAMMACKAWNATERFTRWLMLTLAIAAASAGLMAFMVGPAAGTDPWTRWLNAFPFTLAGSAIFGLLMTAGRQGVERRSPRAQLMLIPALLACLPLLIWFIRMSPEQSRFSAGLSAAMVVMIQSIIALGAVMLALALTRQDGRRGLWLFVTMMVQVFLMVVGLIMLGLLMMTHDQAGPTIARWLGLEPQLQDWSLGSLMLRWFGLHALLTFAAGVVGALTLLFWPEPKQAGGSLSARTYWLGEKPPLRGETAGLMTPVTAPVVTPASPIAPAAQQVASPASETAVTIEAPSPSLASSPASSSKRDAISSLPPFEPMPDGLESVFPTQTHYAVMALLAAVFVFYASLIPMEYQPLMLEDAIRRFRHVKFYELGIDRRADLLANLVVVVPVTFLMMGALHRPGAGAVRLTVNTLITCVAATVYVVAIEFTQEWFPPRTISQNDMQAGAAGALAGIILWLSLGEHVTYALKQAFIRQGSATALRVTLWLYLIALTGYILFPMDFTFDPDLIRLKAQQGRIAILPWAGDGPWFQRSGFTFVRNVVLFIPVGLLMASPWQSRRPTRMGQLLGVVGLALLMEIIRLPVFTAQNGSMHLAGRIVGGIAGLQLARWVLDETGRLSLGRGWSAPARRWLGLAGALLVAGGAAAALLYPFKFDVGPEIFRRKLELFFNWPFKYYYWAGEWTALTKVVVCMGLFAGVGILMRWGWNTTTARQRQGLAITLLLTLVVGTGIEVAQAASGQRVVHAMSLDQGLPVGLQEQAIDITDNTVSKGMLFSIGKVSDITDLLAYLAGAWVGWVVIGMILPRESEPAWREMNPPLTTANAV